MKSIETNKQTQVTRKKNESREIKVKRLKVAGKEGPEVTEGNHVVVLIGRMMP